MVQIGSSAGSSAPEVRENRKDMPTSRRRHRRIDAHGRCFAQLGGGWEASVMNLSVGGMLLRLRRTLTPGSSYFVKLLLEERVAIVEARVVRTVVSDGQDAECLAGLQFTSVAPDDAECLLGYING